MGPSLISATIMAPAALRMWQARASSVPAGLRVPLMAANRLRPLDAAEQRHPRKTNSSR
jgi:hypothetical protein